MSFSAEQVAILQGDLDSRHVKSRKGAGGMDLSYIEGWFGIAEANRIFGFGAWSSETVQLNVVHAAEGKSWKWGKRKGEKVACRTYNVSYVAKVRVTVGDAIREGTGAGHGTVKEDDFGNIDIGGAHESALKEAETDARKRALMQFGNKFGLALYDKDKANVRAGADDDEPGTALPDEPAAGQPEVEEKPFVPADPAPPQGSISKKAQINKSPAVDDCVPWADPNYEGEEDVREERSEDAGEDPKEDPKAEAAQEPCLEAQQLIRYLHILRAGGVLSDCQTHEVSRKYLLRLAKAHKPKIPAEQWEQVLKLSAEVYDELEARDEQVKRASEEAQSLKKNPPAPRAKRGMRKPAVAEETMQ